QGSTDDILVRSLTNSRQSSRQPSPTRQTNPPYPMSASEMVPINVHAHIIRPPYPMGGSTSSVMETR
ncbi:hypothetical protein PFISCL1PPCAC_18130, partial [Pristionchus fissidentatus]